MSKIWPVPTTTASRGFTIVELLIVIVVIGILAAITIVAFNGVQNKARAGAAQSAVSQANKKILTYAAENADQYPPSLEAAGVTNTQGLEYSHNNDATPRTYGVTATNGMSSFYISNTAPQPTGGGYPGHSAGGIATITNLIANPSVEVNTSSITGAAGGVVISRDTAQSFSGVASLRAVTDGTQTGSGTQQLTLAGTYPAGTYKATMYVKGSTGVQLYGILRPAGGGDAVTPAITMTGGWQRFELPAITVTSSTTTQFSLMVRTTAAVATTFWVDAAMLVEGSTVYPYKDGTSGNWAWNGTAHNSASTGMPL